jgi:hypothetical protein
VSSKSYDKLALNTGIVLDLPHYEASGTILHDVSRSKIQVTAIAAPVWTALPVRGMGLAYDAATQYLEASAADSAALDFTAGDYSIVAWIKPENTGGAEEIIGRYSTNVDGWDCFLFDVGGVGTLTSRHNHGSLGANNNSQCYSTGWVEAGVWYMMGISRSGLYPVHYRNAVPLVMTYEATGMLDADTANRDLTIGVRGTTKNANFWKKEMRRPRVWSRALTQADMLYIWNKEHADYGV